jgi:hypothetical protein
LRLYLIIVIHYIKYRRLVSTAVIDSRTAPHRAAGARGSAQS